MRNPFRKKINRETSQSQLRQEEYSVDKQRKTYDGTSRVIETNLKDVLSHLERISLFQSGDDYILPGSQTSVRALESGSQLFLLIKTTRPLDYNDHPAHGHEEPLARLIRTYKFNPFWESKEYNSRLYENIKT